MTRERLLGDLDAARARFRRALAANVDRLETTVGPDRWTIADVVRHVAAWDDAGAAGIVALEEGSPPDVYADDIDAWNAGAVDARAGLAGRALIDDLDAARCRFRDAVLAAPSRLWGAPAVEAPNGEPVTIEGIVKVWLEHDLEHAAELENLPPATSR